MAAIVAAISIIERFGGQEMSDTMNKIICGDCLEQLESLPGAKMIFADPPDNLGMKYEGFTDKWPTDQQYRLWLWERIHHCLSMITKPGIFWLSLNLRVLYIVAAYLRNFRGYEQRLFIWHYTFGQNRQKDFTPSYRPIMRFIREGAVTYPDAVRVKSARQTKYNDKRANPAGRVPDDVWDFPGVCGTFNEKRKWHPNQHPEALIERIVKFSCKPGDLVIDLFAGTGTVNRVCKRLSVKCIGIEISRFYCKKIAKETGAELILNDV